MKIISIFFILILTSLFLVGGVSAQEDDVLWDESSINILLPEEKLALPIIDDETIIDWEMVGIVVGIVILLVVGYKIKGKKRKVKRKNKK